MIRKTIDGEPWLSFAACRGDSAALWEPPLTAHHVLTCGVCPVRTYCAADGIDRQDRVTVRAAIDCSSDDSPEQLAAAARGALARAVLSHLAAGNGTAVVEAARYA